MGTRLARVVGAAVVAALVAAGCTTSRERQSASAPAGTPSAAASLPVVTPAENLTRGTWRLVRYALPGRRAERVVGDATLSFGTRRGLRWLSLSVLAGCHRLSGEALPGPSSYGVRARKTYPVDTGTGGCLGVYPEFARTVFLVAGAPEVRWRTDRDRLWLRADGGTLVYVRSTPAYDSTPALTLATGERAGWRYRFYAGPSNYGPKVGLALRDAEGEPVRTFRGSVPRRLRPPARWPSHLSPFRTALAGAAFVGGLAPRGTVRVVHRVAPGSPEVALRLYDLGGVPWPAFGGIVAAHHDERSTITAYGRDGRVIGGWAGWRL